MCLNSWDVWFDVYLDLHNLTVDDIYANEFKNNW